MIEELFPDDVVTVVATPEMWDQEPHPEEARLVRKAVTKRRREFAAGRSCARQALQALGVQNFPLLSGPHREPLWPAGIVGSLTHCDGYCAAVAARTDVVAGLGVDAELSDALETKLIPRICTQREIDWCRTHPAPPDGDWHKIIFSAKEAIYKCLFPFVQRVLEYREVEVEFDPATQAFTTRLLFAPPTALELLPPLRGRFVNGSEHVATGVVLELQR